MKRGGVLIRHDTVFLFASLIPKLPKGLSWKRDTTRNQKGETLLMRVADAGHLEDLRRLLTAPTTNPNDQNHAGQTALMYACRRNRGDVAR